MRDDTKDWLTLGLMVAVGLALLWLTWGCRSLVTPTIEYTGTPSIPTVDVPQEADVWKLAATGGTATLLALVIRWIDHRFKDGGGD